MTAIPCVQDRSAAHALTDALQRFPVCTAAHAAPRGVAPWRLPRKCQAPLQARHPSRKS